MFATNSIGCVTDYSKHVIHRCPHCRQVMDVRPLYPREGVEIRCVNRACDACPLIRDEEVRHGLDLQRPSTGNSSGNL